MNPCCYFCAGSGAAPTPGRIVWSGKGSTTSFIPSAGLQDPFCSILQSWHHPSHLPNVHRDAVGCSCCPGDSAAGQISGPEQAYVPACCSPQRARCKPTQTFAAPPRDMVCQPSYPVSRPSHTTVLGHLHSVHGGPVSFDTACADLFLHDKQCYQHCLSIDLLTPDFQVQ